MRSVRYKHLRVAQHREYVRILKQYRKLYVDENGVFEHPNCTGCGEPLDLSDDYSMRYGFCCVTCGLHTVGMSWSDFL